MPTILIMESWTAVGYINLSSFPKPFKRFQAFLDLKKQGITSLVIDCVIMAVFAGSGGEIVNMFVPRGKTIVTTKGKIKQASTYKTLREPLDRYSDCSVGK